MPRWHSYVRKYPSKRLITPHIPRPAPSAITSDCIASTAELKKAIDCCRKYFLFCINPLYGHPKIPVSPFPFFYLNPNKKSAHKDVKRRGAALMGGKNPLTLLLSAADMKLLVLLIYKTAASEWMLPF